MSYLSAFHDIIYGDDALFPAVLRYRVGILSRSEMTSTAVIQLALHPSGHQAALLSPGIRIKIVNRLLEIVLPGIRLASVRLVVGTGIDAMEYDLVADMADYLARGNPSTARSIRTRAGNERKESQVSGDEIITGRMKVLMFEPAKMPLSPDLVALLNDE